MDGTNLGWWVVVLPLAVPPLLLLVVHLLARLESWMFAPDERAAKVATLLQEVEAPDEIEEEVTRLLAEVAEVPDRPAETATGAADGLRPAPGRRSDRGWVSDRRATLRRAVSRTPVSRRGRDRTPEG